MHSSLFFKLFPPPSYLAMPHTGLDISDDAIRCIEFRRTFHGLIISKYATEVLPDGLVHGADISDEKEFLSILSTFVAKHSISYCKVSLPEEKTYLFQTDVPSADFSSIAQNIESKIDQNVPLAAPDALFHFDLIPAAVTGGSLRASVSVAPRSYVEHYIELLRKANVTPISFEVVPKAIVATYSSVHDKGTQLIIHVMNKKTGLYIVSEGVVCFTSTIMQGSIDMEHNASSNLPQTLMKEIERVFSYWGSRSDVHSNITEVIIAGAGAVACGEMIRRDGVGIVPHSTLIDVWHNAFNINQYIPPITHIESLAYAVAAGLALPSY